MPIDNRSREEILSENERLLFRLEEAEETLQAIYSGEVDAFVIYMPEGEKVFTLQGAEHPYRVLVETMSEGAAFLAIGGMIVYCNRQLSDMLQVPMEKLTGSLLVAYVASEDQALVADWVENPVRQGDRHEITLKTATGNRLPVLFSCATVELAGKPGVSVVVTDISKRKQAEDALRESESRFRTMANAAPVLIWVAGTDQRCIWVNQVWLDFTGRTLEQEQGNGWTKGVHPDDLKRCLATYASHFEWREAFRMEYRLRRHDGKYRWLADHGVPLVDGEGNFTGYIGSCFDVTPAKELTNDLHQTLKSLGDESSRLETLLATASDGIHILDEKGNVVQFSDSFARMLGYTHAETARLNVVDWDTQIPKGQLLDELNRIFQYPAKFETRHRRKDGSIIDVEVNAKGVKLEGEHYLYASARDITERKQTEEALRESEARLDFALQNGLLGAWEMDLQDHTTTRTLIHDRIYGYETLLPRWTYEMFLEHVLPEDRPEVDRIFRAAVAAQSEWHFEFRIRRADGEVRWVYAAGGHLQNAQGKPERVSGIVQDITDRKQAQISLEQLTREQQAMLDNELVGIMKLRDRCATWINQAMECIFGYGSGELDGQSMRVLYPDDASYHALGKIADPILNSQGSYRTQLEMVRKDGEKLWMDISAAKLSGSDDESLWVLADITPLKKYQDKIEHIAFHDSLTALPNRLLVADRLHQALAQALRSNQMLAVCYLDLDGFKPVNDSFGHDAGDKLLIEIARRLRASIRANDTVGRLGGDEFVLLLTGLENAGEYQLALQRIIEAINQPVAIDETQEVTVTSSIGVALFPHDATDPDTLLRHADQAMYVAKESGRNRYCLFDANQDTAMKTGQESLAGIRRALDRHEFVLHYQPKVNMKTGAVMGAEALVRWQHPGHGLLLPAAFLPILKNHPYGIELGEWVIDAAFAQLAQWHGQGFDIPVSVNIGARHLQSDGFALRLRERFAAHPAVRPGQFELEVLESSALEDGGNASKVMQACCEIGIHFALDDFGTGYSSLAYLKRLPVDILKIDQSFIRDMLNDPEHLSIVEGVIGLAKSFRQQVIAEGVETAGQGERLLALGCDLAQGYAIAKPMPGAELPGWVAAWRQNSVWTV